VNITKLVRPIFAAVIAFSLYCPAAVLSEDFGDFVEKKLNRNSNKLFGIKKPLEESAPEVTTPYRTASQTAADQAALGKGLRATYLTRSAGNNLDMMTFFPASNPTHLIACIEGARSVIHPGPPEKFNPSVQRINLTTGVVETIVRGLDRCDGIRTTQWGTILATEETSDGGAYEILNPLATTNVTITDRETGANDNPAAVAKRTALPVIAWEGIAILPNGVVYAGDELRPGTGTPDVDGGAIFKFIPTTPHAGGNITDLSQSPFVDGAVLAMRISCTTGVQYGQGCEIGNGSWVGVTAVNARSDADTNGATGYYRPEDLHQDPIFAADSQNPNAVRFCWTNTGNEDGKNYAEVVCAVDHDPILSNSIVIANRFVEGDADFNSFDNLDFQPGTGILYVIEDHDNGDVFACLRDGRDRDIKTDGCIKVISVKDTSAEPSGFIFSPDGRIGYLSIQHSDDTNMPLVDDYATDDLLIISGFAQVKD
jgi:hypothetical protein